MNKLSKNIMRLLIVFVGLQATQLAWATNKAHSFVYQQKLGVNPTFQDTSKGALINFAMNFAAYSGIASGMIISSVLTAYIVRKLDSWAAPVATNTNTSITPTERFSDVAAAYEAKKELQKIVDYIKNPKEFTRFGAKPPKGILLVGPPGNGKTLLARAMAGEAGCHFIGIGASELTSPWMHQSSANIKALFAQARPHKPCIIFIDEIDAIGAKRPDASQDHGISSMAAHDQIATVNQLLTELDGFNTKGEPIIVIAATNNPQSLDPALMRPGRFDRKIVVPNPNEQEREEILRIHAAKVATDDAINFSALAQTTPNFSGADLANLINEAARIASDAQREKVSMVDLQDAWQIIRFGGTERDLNMTADERKTIAYNQAGQALIPFLLPDITDQLYMVTINARGQNIGMTLTLPDRQKVTETKDEMLAQITQLMGGYAAEQIAFNQILHHTQTKNDPNLQKAAEIAQHITNKVDLFGTTSPVDILRACYEHACALLQTNKPKLDALAAKLLEKNTLQATEVSELLESIPNPTTQLGEETDFPSTAIENRNQLAEKIK